MKNFFPTRLLAGLAWLGMALPGVAQAAPFTPGNLVVVRVGDGTTATPTLSSTATTTYLLEYTPGGTLVQTITLPTAASGTNAALTNTGSSSSDALLSRSSDGRCLIITGYDAAPGTATLTNTAATAVNRVIGRVAADGTVDTSTRLADAFGGTASTAVNIRSATSTNGTYFYAVGSGGGVRFVPFGNPAATATVQVAATPANNRGVGIFDGSLYVSSSTSVGGFYGLSQIGTGLTTNTGQPATLLSGFPSAVPTGGTTPSPYGFYFADLSASVPGVDVVYVADDRAAPDGGLQKWSLVGGTWTLNGTVTGVAARGLSGSLVGSIVSLAVSGSGGLYFLADNAGYNAAPSTTVFPNSIATPGTNSSFRGVAFAPVVPNITSISPSTAVAGTTATTLTLTGSGFISNSIANISGPISFIGLPTTLVSGTQLAVSLPAYAPVANYLVSLVNNPGFAGIGSNSIAFTLTAAPNAPTITGLTPLGGSTGTVITVTGTNFTGTTAVRLVNTTAGPVTTPVNVPAFTVASATTITFTLPVTPTQVRVLVTTPNGTAVSSGILNIVTATRPDAGLPGLAVYPNPATDRLTVELPNPAPATATVALRDLAGRLVLAPAPLAADHQLRLPTGLARGMYLLEVRQSGTRAVRRIERR